MGARSSLQPYPLRRRLRLPALWTPFAERRRIRSEGAAIKVVLGAELRLHAGYTLEAFQRVAGVMTFPEHKGIENAATIRAFIAARLLEPLVYPNVAAKLGSVGASADRVVDFYTTGRCCANRF
jgi:hypothetical protein